MTTLKAIQQFADRFVSVLMLLAAALVGGATVLIGA